MVAEAIAHGASFDTYILTEGALAQVNIGQNSKAVHRAYSRNAPVEMPALSEYEKQQKAIICNRNTEPAAQAVAA